MAEEKRIQAKKDQEKEDLLKANTKPEEAPAEEDEEDEDEDDEDRAVFIEKKRCMLFGLPISLTKYTISPSMVTIDKGLINIQEDDCYIYKIQDVKMTRSLFERMFGIGTVQCYTADNTNPTLVLEHVQHAKEIKNYLLKQSEIVRLKRKTFNTMDITAKGVDVDGNGIPDFLE